MADTVSPIGVFAASFCLSGFAGLAALLRSGKPLNLLNVFSSLLNSGLLGLAMAMVWYMRFQENIYFLVGVCVLAGLGGMTTVDLVLTAIRKGGFSIQMGKDGSVRLPEGDKTDEPKQ